MDYSDLLSLRRTKQITFRPVTVSLERDVGDLARMVAEKAGGLVPHVKAECRLRKEERDLA